MRLYVKEAIYNTVERLVDMQKAILDMAEANKDEIMPGYTHLQRAQPVLFAHHLLAYFEMLQRDVERFRDCLKRADVMPLGSGALAGVPYPVDREFLARELGFSQISENSIDAVSDRDFVIEYQAAASIAMMHISRLAEELVLWSSAEFGFVELDDAFTTGSSLMPQKKNPDVAELARGKTGRVYGNLLAILTTMKSLPLSYNRDLQEDKEGLFDCVDTLLATLDVFAGMVSTATVKVDRIHRAAEDDYILATDLADYLVKKGVPFREAHSIVGGLVQHAIENGKGFKQLGIDEYKSFSPHFDEDVYSITIDSSVKARNAIGGTAPEQVEKQLVRARKIVESV
jgi:argininosuccinate lyase